MMRHALLPVSSRRGLSLASLFALFERCAVAPASPSFSLHAEGGNLKRKRGKHISETRARERRAKGDQEESKRRARGSRGENKRSMDKRGKDRQSRPTNGKQSVGLRVDNKSRESRQQTVQYRQSSARCYKDATRMLLGCY
jgi:hypothetical protein